MANFNELKDKALSAMGTIIDKSTELYGVAEEKAKYIAKTTKLKADIAKDRTEQKKLYADLGSMYFSLHKDSPEDGLLQICEEIKVIADKIELKQRELDSLAGEAGQPDIEVNIEEEEKPAEDSCGCCAEPENAASDEDDAE